MIKFRPLTIREFAVLLIVLASVALISVANATPPNKKPPPVSVKNNTNQSVEQNNRQETTVFQSTLQQNTMTAGDVNVDAGDVSFDYERNAPAVGRGSLFPTATCALAVDAGFSLPGGSLSGGKAYIDEICRQLEWIKAGHSMGMRDAAIWEWCSMDQGDDNPYCHADEFQDYKSEVIGLRAQQDLMLKDNGELEQAKRELQKQITDMAEELKERDRRIFEAGVQK